MAAREHVPHAYHLAVAEIDGRFYPVRAHYQQEGEGVVLDFSPQFRWEYEITWTIPFAIGPQPTRGLIFFRTYRDALNYCHRYHEHFQLLVDWDKQTAGSELYPERNAWYRDELLKLVRGGLWISPSVSYVHAGAFLPDGTYCTVQGETIDDAYAKLYEDICQHCEQGPLAAVMVTYEGERGTA